MLASECNGVAKKENLSSNGNLITYKRKKRTGTCESFPQENGRLSPKKVDSGKTNAHCRHVLNHMLQLTDGDGIKCCIADALIHLSSKNISRTEMADINKESIETKHKYNHHVLMPDPSVDNPETAIREQIDANNLECQKSFFNILCSEEFIMLCNIVCGGVKVDKLFNINHISLKMNSGAYGLSPRTFFKDLQQMWEDFQRVGEEMVALARTLSNMSKDTINCNTDKDELACEVCLKKADASCSETQIIQFSQPVPYPILNQTAAPMTYKEEEELHGNCTVCEKLETIAEAKEPATYRTATSRLCKYCGTCEDEDRRFLICGHDECPYKYYHIRCLKNSQVASHQQRDAGCWYCPSCLCRGCFRDEHDEKIVLCDGCDGAYHVYCMKPPRASVPKGQWYCLRCNVEKAKEGVRRYERWVLQKNMGKRSAGRSWI